MIGVLCVLVICLAVVIICAWVKLYGIINRPRLENEPPLVPGHFLLGNSLQFRNDAVAYLQNCTKQFGEMFTLRFLNQRITFVTDVHAYQDFCHEQAFSFEPIEKQVNWNVFHFVVRKPRAQVRESSRTLRGKHYFQTLASFCKHVYHGVNDFTADRAVSDAEWKEENLRNVCADVMFSSIFYTLFGTQYKNTAFNPHEMSILLTKFHKYFNYLWLGVPIQFFGEAKEALRAMLDMSPPAVDMLNRDDVVPYIRNGMRCMLDAGQTEEEVRKHNLALLHVNYNMFRVTFWSLYNLMIYSEAREAVLREVHDFVTEKVQDGKVMLSIEDLLALPYLDSFVKETLRVSSGVLMVRGVTKDTKFTTFSGREYLLRSGDKVAICPPIIHHDPEVFPEPHKFLFDRFVASSFFKDGREVKHPLLPFGNLCPAQVMAVTQVKLFLLAWCSQIEAQLMPNESTAFDQTCFGNEILPPQKDVRIRFKRVANVQFVMQ